MNILDLLLAASLGLVVFLASVLVLVEDQRERARLRKEAAIRRIKGEDTRPLQFLPAPTLPWKHEAWKSPMVWPHRTAGEAKT